MAAMQDSSTHKNPHPPTHPPTHTKQAPAQSPPHLWLGCFSTPPNSASASDVLMLSWP